MKNMVLMPVLAVCFAGMGEPSWTLDFQKGLPSGMGWWSINKKADACSLGVATNAATGRAALRVHWDGVGTWMHAYQTPPAQPFPLDGRVLVTARVTVDDAAAARVRACNLRLQDRNLETFYFDRRVRWERPGTYDLHWLVETNSLASVRVVKHGPDENHLVDAPVASAGLNFDFVEDAGPCTVLVDGLQAESLPPPDPARRTAMGLARPLLVPAERPLVVAQGGTAAKAVNPATGKAAVKCEPASGARTFGAAFTRFGSPMGVQSMKLPKYEEAEILLDVTATAASAVDGVRLKFVDTGSGLVDVDVRAPQLGAAGRHVVSVKLPRRVVSSCHWCKGREQGLFAFSAVLFTSSKKGVVAPMWIDGARLNWTSLAAHALALDVVAGDEVRFVAPGTRTATASFTNISDRDLSFDVAARLVDYRDQDAGWKLAERLVLKGGEARTFEIPVPDRLGIYYVDAEVRSAGSEPWDPVRLRSSFLKLKETGASPRLADRDDFCFGSVAHLNPYFGNAYEIERMADLMSRIGLKVLRTDIRPYTDFDWTWYDRVVDVFTAKGMDIDFILGNVAAPDGTPRWDLLRERWRKAFARYRGRVRFWEMLNEPDVDWGRAHPTGARDYALLSFRTAQDLRELDPSATFMSAGFCTFDHKIMGTFQRDALALCWNVFDLHCFHGHGSYQGFRGTIDDKLLGLRRDLGITIPWYANETAITGSCGTGERVQAETLWKKLTFAWSRGAKGLTWYNMRGKGENPDEGEHGYGMMTFDLRPRAVCGAWNTLTSLYAHRRFDRAVDCGTGVTCFVFAGGKDRPAAESRAACLWLEKGVGKTVAFRTTSKRVVRVDMFGNREEVPVSNGAFALTATSEPCTLLFDGALAPVLP